MKTRWRIDPLSCQMSTGSGDIDHNLAKMTSGVQVLKTFLRLFEFEDFVDHWMDLMLRVETTHFLEAVPWAVQNAFDRDVAP